MTIDIRSLRQEALIAAEDHEYRQRRYHNDQTHDGCVRVPARVLVELCDKVAEYEDVARNFLRDEAHRLMDGIVQREPPRGPLVLRDQAKGAKICWQGATYEVDRVEAHGDDRHSELTVHAMAFHQGAGWLPIDWPKARTKWTPEIKIDLNTNATPPKAFSAREARLEYSQQPPDMSPEQALTELCRRLRAGQKLICTSAQDLFSALEWSTTEELTRIHAAVHGLDEAVVMQQQRERGMWKRCDLIEQLCKDFGGDGFLRDPKPGMLILDDPQMDGKLTPEEREETRKHMDDYLAKFSGRVKS